jgi:hypothetical protein
MKQINIKPFKNITYYELDYWVVYKSNINRQFFFISDLIIHLFK